VASPFEEVIELTSREIAGSSVEIARWRDDADRSLAFNNEVSFLIASDWQKICFEVAYLLCAAPYSNACTAKCENFDQAAQLVRELRTSLLILTPQNLLLVGDGVFQLGRLLNEMPELRVIVYTGSETTKDGIECAGLGAMLDSTPAPPRIQLTYPFLQPEEFHPTIARRFGLPRAYHYLKASSTD
jgi:hypothetical protein